MLKPLKTDSEVHSPRGLELPGSRDGIPWIEQEVRGELANVKRWITSLSHESSSEELQGGGDNTPLSEAGDATQTASERALSDEQLLRLHERAACLEHALKRIHEGSYGICADCGQPIHPQRLRALPEVDTCLQCAERR